MILCSQEFDHLGKDQDEGWAEMHEEVDYSEKIVFSDEEEASNSNMKHDRNR